MSIVHYFLLCNAYGFVAYQKLLKNDFHFPKIGPMGRQR